MLIRSMVRKSEVKLSQDCLGMLQVEPRIGDGLHRRLYDDIGLRHGGELVELKDQVVTCAQSQCMENDNKSMKDSRTEPTVIQSVKEHYAIRMQWLELR
eukprot:5407641-Pleurochrysis_carterae.AAC.4